jgi:hypothetical protein
VAAPPAILHFPTPSVGTGGPPLLPRVPQVIPCRRPPPAPPAILHSPTPSVGTGGPHPVPRRRLHSRRLRHRKIPTRSPPSIPTRRRRLLKSPCAAVAGGPSWPSSPLIRAAAAGPSSLLIRAATAGPSSLLIRAAAAGPSAWCHHPDRGLFFRSPRRHRPDRGSSIPSTVVTASYTLQFSQKGAGA